MEYLNRSEVVAGHQLVKFDKSFMVFRVYEPDLTRDNEEDYEALFSMTWEEVLEACLQWKIEKIEKDKADAK